MRGLVWESLRKSTLILIEISTSILGLSKKEIKSLNYIYRGAHAGFSFLFLCMTFIANYKRTKEELWLSYSIFSFSLLHASFISYPCVPWCLAYYYPICCPALRDHFHRSLLLLSPPLLLPRCRGSTGPQSQTTDCNLYYSSTWSEPGTPHTQIQTCFHKFCGCAVNAFKRANQIKRMKVNLSTSFTALELLLRSAAGIINEHKLINEIKTNGVFHLKLLPLLPLQPLYRY